MYGLEYIISLNFQHINKVKTKIMTENINIRQGYAVRPSANAGKTRRGCMNNLEKVNL